MSRSHKTFVEICDRLGLNSTPNNDLAHLMGAELHNFYRDDFKHPMRPALIAQVAKFTGTDIQNWLNMESLDLGDAVKGIDVEHIETFKSIQLPLSKDRCLFCGLGRIALFRTLNYKQCLECGEREDFKLKPNQEPLLGSSRNITKGKKDGV